MWYFVSALRLGQNARSVKLLSLVGQWPKFYPRKGLCRGSIDGTALRPSKFFGSPKQTLGVCLESFCVVSVCISAEIVPNVFLFKYGLLVRRLID